MRSGAATIIGRDTAHAHAASSTGRAGDNITGAPGSVWQSAFAVAPM
jgi:hypothetical protein